MNDELKKSIEEIEKTEEIFEPDIYGLEHITDFDSYDERLKDALADYEAACRVLEGLEATRDKPEKRSKSLLDKARELIAFYDEAMKLYNGPYNESYYYPYHTTMY